MKTMLILLAVAALGPPLAWLGLAPDAPSAGEARIAAGRSALAAGLERDPAPIPAEIACTAERASDHVVRLVYETAFLGVAQVPSKAAGEARTRALVDTYVDCGGDPREAIRIVDEGGGEGLALYFVGAMAAAGR